MMDHFNYRQPPLFFFLALVFVGMLLGQPSGWQATPALAQTAIAPTQDTFVDPNNASTNYDGKRLELAYSNFPTLVGTRRVLLQFDLRSVTGAVLNAPVVLTAVENNFPAGATLTLGLYGLADTWTEAAVTEATRPAVGAKLQTVTVAAGTTGAVRFDAAAVGTYLEAQRTGDGVASFLLQLDAGSGTLGFGGNLFFEDSEGSSNGVNGDEPAIDAPTVPTSTPTATSTTPVPTATETPTPTATSITPAPTAIATAAPLTERLWLPLVNKP